MLNAEQTAALLPYPQLVAALRRAVAELAEGLIACPARQVEPMQKGALLLSMIATAPDIAAHKLISVVPDNPQRGLPTISGRVSVVDAIDGTVRLVLDGATVTGRRTAALSMLGVELLLGRAPRHAVLVGAGTQARNHAQALAALYPDARLSAATRSAASLDALCAQAPGVQPASLAAIPADADLVITCTTSSQPVYREPAQPGRLLIAVGAFKPEAAEIAPETVRASRLFVDDPHGARHEAGDLLQANVHWTAVRGIAEAIGAMPMADSEPVLFKTVGCAAWDLAAARVALANSR